MTETIFSLPLPVRLEEFELTGVLGEGGFSVVYAAFDRTLERTVAIKEYMPGAIATRLPNGMVLPKSPQHEDTFRAGLASFLNEARLLAKFTHPALVHIHRVWEQNGTAYMAMQYCVGQTLRQISQSDPAMVKDERWLKTTFAPILDALELLHAQHCFHRDISPDNILVLQGGGPVLLDFGAARQIIGDMIQALTVILKPGFAPIEQYADDSSLQQGAWTDVYSVGAVLYYLLMGKPPVASVARLVKDPLAKLADSDDLAGVSHSFREAIDHALAVHPNERIQSIPDLREALRLPTFKPDNQVKRSVDAPLEILQTPPETMPGGNKLSASTEPDDAAHVSPSPATADAASSFHPDQDTSDPPQPNAAAETTRPSIDPPSKLLRDIALGIGLIVIVLAIAFGLLHQPAATEGKGDSVTNNPFPAKDVSQPSSSADSSVAPPDARASAALVAPALADPASTPQESTSEKPATAAPSNVQEPSATSKTIISPTKENPQKAASSNANEKTPVKPISAPFEHAPGPVTTSPDSSPPTEISPTKGSQQTETVNALESMKAAPPPISDASSSQTPVVRLLIRPWGQVTVDGQPRGVSPPLTRLPLTPGEHAVVITNGDFPAANMQITIPEKGEVVISHQFGSQQ